MALPQTAVEVSQTFLEGFPQLSRLTALLLTGKRVLTVTQITLITTLQLPGQTQLQAQPRYILYYLIQMKEACKTIFKTIITFLSSRYLTERKKLIRTLLLTSRGIFLCKVRVEIS